MIRQFSEIKQERISVDKLEIGMFVSEIDRPWSETPFIFQGFKISDEDTLVELKQLCKNVVIDVKRSSTLAKHSSHIHTAEHTSEKEKSLTNPVCFERELNTAEKIFHDSRQNLQSVHQHIKSTRELDFKVIQELVQDCIKSINRNESALTWLSQIKNTQNYLTEHALRVLVIAIKFGKALELDDHKLNLLGLSSLLYDIGNLQIPNELLTKAGRLNLEERTLVRQHTSKGYEFLQQHDDVPEEVRLVALQHHERIDGKGYPQGLTSDKISELAKIIAIVDCYDALTSDRSYKTATSPMNALKRIYETRGLQFDRLLVEQFINHIGIYPPGYIAELNSGHIGIILSNEDDHKLRPKILIVRTPDKKSCVERVLDLSSPRKLKNGQTLKIKNVLNNGAFGIDLKFYQEKLLRLWRQSLKETA